jgi:hypothetical protein
VHTRPCGGEDFVRNRFAIQADAFVDAFKMRRSVEPGAQTGGTKDRLKDGSRRTLAVRTGDVSARDGAMRISQIGREHGDIFEAKFLDSGLLRCCKFSAERQKRADGIFVIHLRSRSSRFDLRALFYESRKKVSAWLT